MFNNFRDLVSYIFRHPYPLSNKITCYHCGEKSTPSRTLYVNFQGADRSVCCNGCAAILKTVDELGMCEEYQSQKAQISYPHEQQ